MKVQGGWRGGGDGEGGEVGLLKREEGSCKVEAG